MKKLLLLFLILFIAIGLGFLVQNSTGYVMVVYQHWVISTNIWIAAITAIVAFIVLYTLIRLFRNTITLPKRLRKYHHNQRAHKKQQQFMSGLSHYATGDFAQAEKLFLRSLSRTGSKALHYLAAAYSAQARGAISNRDKYLTRALQKTSGNQLAIAFTEAELYLKHQDYQKALNLLEPLLANHTKNRRLLQLLSACYLKSNDFNAWLTLLPELKKYRILPEHELIQTEHKAYLQSLEHALACKDITIFEQCWASLPNEIKLLPDIITCYLTYCSDFQPPHVAQSFIESLMKKSWQPEFLLLYIKKTSNDADALKQQLQVAETWLKKHGEDPTLLTVLASLCLKTNFPGKAADYARQAFELKPEKKAMVLLADVLNQLGEKDKAITCYQIITQSI